MWITGTVIGGNKIGRKLGFPTANVAVDEQLAATDGVYAARITVGGRTYDGMANLGRKPSVGGGGARVLEVNIFDFDEDIYGLQIEVELLDFIRPERRFDSFDELKEQITKDKQQILCTLTKNCPTK